MFNIPIAPDAVAGGAATNAELEHTPSEKREPELEKISC